MINKDYDWMKEMDQAFDTMFGDILRKTEFVEKDQQKENAKRPTVNLVDDFIGKEIRRKNRVL